MEFDRWAFSVRSIAVQTDSVDRRCKNHNSKGVQTESMHVKFCLDERKSKWRDLVSADSDAASWRDFLLNDDREGKMKMVSKCYRQQWLTGPRIRDKFALRSFSMDRCTRKERSYYSVRSTSSSALHRYRPNIFNSTAKGPSHQSCGVTPPSLKQLRSYSVDNNHHANAQSERSRQRSVSGSVENRKPTFRRIGEDALKRSRLHNSQYELSQDLLEKQVEILEKKYGGVCARKAALTIQHAFRKYCIVKRFQDIANAFKGEKRLTRRFPSIDLESREWTTNNNSLRSSIQNSDKTNGDSMSSRGLKSSVSVNDNMKSNFTFMYRELNENFEIEDRYSRKPKRSYSMWEPKSYTQPVNLKNEVFESIQNNTESQNGVVHENLRGSIKKTKVPPQVPKRTSSISRKQEQLPSLATVETENTSSNSSLSTDASVVQDHSVLSSCESSPVWKHKSVTVAEDAESKSGDRSAENVSQSSDRISLSEMPNSSPAYSCVSKETKNQIQHDNFATTFSGSKNTEIQRKRQYRVGLNFFNKKPDRGIRYLIQKGFLEASPQAVARFLLTRKGLSKQMIGEYLGDIQNNFNMAVLECFTQELDLAGMQVDVALRKFLTHFRIPGEAQKIEYLMEVFTQQYNKCNPDIVSKFCSPDTVFVLSFAIIMLNTDLHTPNMKAERRMKLEDFIKNLRGVDEGHDLDREMLIGIYERIKTNEFKTGSDHVTQVLKVQQTIVGKKTNLALSHRRLVCYCRLYEVYDLNKKERTGVHQREIFLFNDLLMVTKIFSKKKNGITYTFRQSFPLYGLCVTLFGTPYYPYGIRLSQRVDNKVLVTFNARNEHDRSKFVEDLKESVLEMDEMENLRIEAELEKQKLTRVRSSENRDSGVADIEIFSPAGKEGKLSTECLSVNLKRSTLSNSLLDLHDQQANKTTRRGSAGSLDSGMSSTGSTVSHDSTLQTSSSDRSRGHQQGFLGGIFSRKGTVKSRQISA